MPPTCAIQITNASTADMGVTVPRRDGPALLVIPSGATVDVDVTELVWPPPPAEPRAPRADVFDLVCLCIPTALLAAAIWIEVGALVSALSSVGWAWTLRTVWKAARS